MIWEKANVEPATSLLENTLLSLTHSLKRIVALINERTPQILDSDIHGYRNVAALSNHVSVVFFGTMLSCPSWLMFCLLVCMCGVFFFFLPQYLNIY